MTRPLLSTPPPAAVVGALAFTATIYVPLWSLYSLGLEAPFRYFAADAFYYLAIAKNSLAAGFYSYDGVHPTNGFNPLWQYYLAWGSGRFAANQEQLLLMAFLSSALFAALGTAFFAVSLYGLVRRPPWVLLAVIPGIYYLGLSMFDPHFGSSWSFINGMETGLSILLFGLLCYAVVVRHLLDRPTTTRVAVASTLITLITLSRLDDIFLFLPLFALIALRAPDRRRAVRLVGVAATIPIVVIGAYLVYNYGYAGLALPISGVAKSDGLLHPVAWIDTLQELTLTLVPSDGTGGRWAWSGAAWRAFQLIVPLVASLQLLFHLRRSASWRTCLDGLDPARQALFAIAILYVPAKTAYNLAYVQLWDQGHWYFPLSIMLTNMIVLCAIDARLSPPQRAERGRRAHAWGSWASLAFVAAYVVLCGNAFIQLKHHDTYGADFYNFWAERRSISARLDALMPSGGIIEFDDGIVAYALSRPTINGMALAGDAQVLESASSGEMLELAYERGARLIASVWYMQEWPAAAFSDPEAFRKAMLTLANVRHPDRWKFTLLLHQHTPAVHYVVAAFEPATEPATFRRPEP